MSKPTNSNLFLVLAGPQVKIARLAVSFLPPQHLPSQKFLFKQWQLTQPSHRAGANVYPWPPFSALSHENMQNPFKNCLHYIVSWEFEPVHMHWPPASEFPHFTALLRWRQAARNDELTDNLVRSEKTEKSRIPPKNLGNVGNDWRTNHFVAQVRLNAIVSGGRIEGVGDWDRVR